MSLKNKCIKIIALLKSLRSALKYGGFQQANISYISYGDVLKGKTVLITGGSRGIGLAIAKKFVEHGAMVVITGRKESVTDEVIKLLQNRAFYFQWDVSDISNIDSRIKHIEQHIKSEIDVLINNAGVYASTQFPHCTESDWDRVYDTNSKGCFFLCQYFCNRWSASKKYKVRKIINISSQGGFVSANNAYRMTKWDLNGLTKFLGVEMSKYGIITNGIAPGLILTDMQADFKKQGDNLFTYLNPANRLAYSEEIAELALFLTGDSSNYIVGQTICCDGGYTLNK